MTTKEKLINIILNECLEIETKIREDRFKPGEMNIYLFTYSTQTMDNIISDEVVDKIIRDLRKLHDELCEELGLRRVLEKFINEPINEETIAKMKHDVGGRLAEMKQHTRMGIEQRVKECVRKAVYEYL